MPDPPISVNFDHVARSDTNNSQSLTPPGVASFYKQIHEHDDTARRTTSYEPNSDFAYGANPGLDFTSCRPVYAASNANDISDVDLISGAPYSLVGSSTDVVAVTNLDFAHFGSHQRPTTPVPYFNFASQSTYEPTGELVRKPLEDSEHPGDQSSFRKSTWISEREKIEAQSQLITGAPSSVSRPIDTFTDRGNSLKPVLKRSLESDADAVVYNQHIDQQPRLQQLVPNKSRRVTFTQMSGTGLGSDNEDTSSSEDPSTSRSTIQARLESNPRRGGARSSIAPSQRPPTHPNKGSKTPAGHPPSILPPEKVFPIQIGSELFRLSGASISSDAPSYFTQFFEEQIRQNQDSGGVRTLYIDRDPQTFRDVARHLQGYHVKPGGGSQFVKLFADAQFYSLPRLIAQLFEAEIFIQIGEKHFQIPKDLFSDPGNSPNFFSLGFAVFFSTPGEVFPGLDRRGLLRPPSITPPYVPGRSAEIFAQLLHLLRGYPLRVDSEYHRTELLRDCRYFHLRGLEQKIIAHDISYNLERRRTEICLRIEDIKPSGISYKSDDSESEDDITGGWVRYARPFVDDDSYELIAEIGGETTFLDLNHMRVDFHGLAKARVSSLFQVVANKMNLPTNAPLAAMVLSGGGHSSHASPGNTPLSEDRVKVRFEPASDIWLDGLRYDIDCDSPLGQCMIHGPAKSNGDSDGSNAMNDDLLASRPGHAHHLRGRGNQQLRNEGGHSMIPKQNESNANISSSQPGATSKTSRKRRRPITSTDPTTSEHGGWIIRNGQWRLRVQKHEHDGISSGYEIVFVAVKLDAFSQERARNARRKFLGNG